MTHSQSESLRMQLAAVDDISGADEDTRHVGRWPTPSRPSPATGRPEPTRSASRPTLARWRPSTQVTTPLPTSKTPATR